MRRILEAHLGIDIHDPPPARLHHLVGYLEPLPDKPLLRREAADFLKVALEGGEAPAGIVRQLLEGELVHIILIHEVDDVYLPRLVEVEKGGRKARVDVEQRQQPLLELEVHQVVLRLHIRVEVGRHGREQAGNLRRPGELDDLRLELRQVGGETVARQLPVHLAEEVAGEHQEDAAIPLAVAGFLQQGNMVVAGDEDAFALAYMDLLPPVVEHHFPGIDIVHGIFARTVGADRRVVVEEAEKDVVVVEYDLHGIRCLFVLASLLVHVRIHIITDSCEEGKDKDFSGIRYPDGSGNTVSAQPTAQTEQETLFPGCRRTRRSRKHRF